MRKKIQIHLPVPCSEDWNKMTTADKGRFCLSCKKEVIDFAGMTDDQLVSFFKKPATASVCGRFQPAQLNRELIPSPKSWPFIKYFFRFTLPAFLLTLKAGAQKENLKGKVAITCVKETIGDTEIIRSEIKPLEKSMTIKGKVVDKEGRPVYYASIRIKGTNEGTVADSLGNYSLQIKSWPAVQTLSYSSVGYDSVEKEIKLNGDNQQTVILTTMETPLMGLAGEVVVTSARKAKKKKLKETVNLIDTLLQPLQIFRERASIQVYPNPATPGSTVTIAGKGLLPGAYTLELLDLNGLTLFADETTLSNEQRIRMNLPAVKTGPYFLKMTARVSGKNCTQKLIIQ